jgi:hypothetical protein
MDRLNQFRLKTLIKSLNNSITRSEIRFSLSQVFYDFLVNLFQALNIACSACARFRKTF